MSAEALAFAQSFSMAPKVEPKPDWKNFCSDGILTGEKVNQLVHTVKHPKSEDKFNICLACADTCWPAKLHPHDLNLELAGDKT